MRLIPARFRLALANTSPAIRTTSAIRAPAVQTTGPALAETIGMDLPTRCASSLTRRRIENRHRLLRIRYELAHRLPTVLMVSQLWKELRWDGDDVRPGLSRSLDV